jgi:radical SAM protein with 4Fe4S-binding SPASM domain
MNRVNPFAAIYDLCNDPGNRGDPARLPEFPRYVDIELTNVCNFKCLMCPTGTGIAKRKKGFMSEEIFSRLFDELKTNRTPVRFIGWGEPLLHQNLTDILATCRKSGMLTHLNTNGLLLDNTMMEQFIGIPLNSLKFSFQGIDRKSYREMRNRDYFNDLIDKIRTLYQLRRKEPYPFIHVSTTITYETPEQAQKFRHLVEPFVDLVTIGRTTMEFIDPDEACLSMEESGRLRHLIKLESVVKKHPVCPEVFNVLSVNWDGSVSACCTDFDNRMIVGNIAEQSLYEIWHSKKMNTYRKLLAGMKHDLLDICRNCYDNMSLQEPGIQNI